MSPLPALICDYLDGDDASLGVFNDALEELGRDRLVESKPLPARLQIVLDGVLPDHLAQRVALDFAEHVHGECDCDEARSLLQAKRRWLEDSGRNVHHAPARLVDSLYPLGWSDDNTPRSNAAWALWSALIMPPKFVAAAAQRVRRNELSWQIEHIKQVVMSQL